MCGIFGYVGNKEAAPILIRGLKDLEYRGYDSAGFYISGSGSKKAVGPVKNLELKVSKKDKGTLGIAHTRWATHGKSTEINAHPHTGKSGRVWLVHNGVIENYREIREKLDIKFKSETDTESVAQLLESFLSKNNFIESLKKTVKILKGSYALAIIDKEDPEKIYVIRKGSPLIIGIGDDEILISSDVSALSVYTNKVIYLEDNEIGVLSKNKYSFNNFSGKTISKKISIVVSSGETTDIGEYKHFMFKEIMEGPEVLKKAFNNRITDTGVIFSELKTIISRLKKVKRIILIGCGTAYYGGVSAKYFFEEYLKIPTDIEVASEFRYRKPVLNKNTLVIALSQSGETADTLEAIKEAKKIGANVIGIVNVPGSSISREVDACIYNNAGPEIGVASTKAFISQAAILIIFGLYLGQINKSLNKNFIKKICEELKMLPEKIAKVLLKNSEIKLLAKKYLNTRDFLYLGRRYQYATALEGALKLKEISYIHAEGYGSGEMKHGPLSMIDKKFPSLVIALKDSLYEKNISTIQEIKARDGEVISVATEGDINIKNHADNVIYVPGSHELVSPIISVVPLHLFAYHIADQKGLNVDKPRNLAKSVTVE